MIKAASLPIDINLLSLSEYLKQQGLSHRINEESGNQIIWANSEAAAMLIQEILVKWEEQTAGERDSFELAAKRRPSSAALLSNNFPRSILSNILTSPITTILIGCCLLVAAFSLLGKSSYKIEFLLFPLISSADFGSLVRDIDNFSVFVRTLMPMFLHFGELHLIFNMLWLWYFGKQLESIQPAWLYASIIVVTSFASNVSQYLYTGYNNFGGMSGVVYGLLGCTWLIHQFMPRSKLEIDNKMFIVFVVFLVVMEVLAGSWIASAAHLGGLVSGLILGITIVTVYRLLLKREIIA
jgi:GlpG protein